MTFDATQAVLAARKTQAEWQELSVADRAKFAGRLRYLLAEEATRLAQLINGPARQQGESLAAEILPLIEACKFLSRRAASILKSKRLSGRDRPSWLARVQVFEDRVPFGVVLVIGASNYPLFLAGVQALQALVAGNAVLLKPGTGGIAIATRLQELSEKAGLPTGLLSVLPEDPASARECIHAQVDLVVLTGSQRSGQAVLSELAKTTTPAIMELSGCDALFILPSAQIALAARAIMFGLTFNCSATCMAPRRVFVPQSLQPALEDSLQSLLNNVKPIAVGHTSWQASLPMIEEAIASGARVVTGDWPAWQQPQTTAVLPLVLADVPAKASIHKADLFVPIVSLIGYRHLDDALGENGKCPYALSACVFGNLTEATQFAKRIEAGCVVINDIIAPTADPRVGFGGTKASGFGTTRGAEGLKQMTQLKSIVIQRGSWRPHLDDLRPPDIELITGLIHWLHSHRLRSRIGGLWQLIQAAIRLKKTTPK